MVRGLRWGLVVVFLSFIHISSIASDDFTDLGPDPFSGNTLPARISRDGSTVVGTNVGSGGMARPFFWRPGMAQFELIDTYSGLLIPNGKGLSVSADGTKFVAAATIPSGGSLSAKQNYFAQSQDNQAYSFPMATTLLPFEGGGAFSDQFLLSADGTKGVGFRRIGSTYEIYRGFDLGTPNQTISYIGIMQGLTTVLQAASDDGSIIGGKYFPVNAGKGFLHMNGAFHGLTVLDPSLNGISEVVAINSSGTLVLGNAKKGPLGIRPFIYNFTTQTLTWIVTTTSSMVDIFASDFSANGNVIIGRVVPKGPISQTFGPPRAFRWVCDQGAGKFIREDIQKTLVARIPGTQAAYWTMETAVSVSGDGRRFTGAGMSPNFSPNAGKMQPWVATLELPPTAGTNGCF